MKSPEAMTVDRQQKNSTKTIFIGLLALSDRSEHLDVFGKKTVSLESVC